MGSQLTQVRLENSC